MALIWVVVAMAAFAAGVVVAIRRARLGRVPLRKIASAPEGLEIRVRGKVRAPEPLVAPYTGRTCVYWRIEYRAFVDGSDLLGTVQQQIDFAIADSSGSAKVLVERAKFEVVADIVELGRASELTPAGRALVMKHGWEIPEVARIELCEAIVATDSPIDIVGPATREPDHAPSSEVRGYRESQATLLVFSSDHVVVEPKRERRYIGRRA
jgi:hypothetical protein